MRLLKLENSASQKISDTVENILKYIKTDKEIIVDENKTTWVYW